MSQLRTAAVIMGQMVEAIAYRTLFEEYGALEE
jgi:hypothetical protein